MVKNRQVSVSISLRVTYAFDSLPLKDSGKLKRQADLDLEYTSSERGTVIQLHGLKILVTNHSYAINCPELTETLQAPSRYGADTNSGHTTPNPAALSAQQPQSQQPLAGQGQHGAYGNYQGHPYYQNQNQQNQYYNAYMSQYAPYQQQNYAAPFGAKGGMYNQPHHGYSQYDQHSSSPANAGGFPQSHGRESTLTSGLGDYARSGSAQPSQNQQQSGAGAFGINDPFTRAQGAFGGQTPGYGQQQAGQQGSSEDALKPFGDSKSGPSPSAVGQPGRPGSATNTSGQTAQSGLPPPQSLQQQSFGSYPGGHLAQMGQTSQYGSALGGLGGGHTAGAQSHQAGGYGAYGAGAAGAGGNAGFGNSYGSYGRGGGGWGGNYGGH
jgi:hypothetical protein